MFILRKKLIEFKVIIIYNIKGASKPPYAARRSILNIKTITL